MIRRAATLLLSAFWIACSATTPPASTAPTNPTNIGAEWAETPAGRAIRPGGRVKSPTVVRHVNPLMSDADVRAGTYGLVRLEIVIDESGHVVHSTVLEAPSASLGQAARTAVEQWTFTPTEIDGTPVRVLFDVAMKFQASALP